MTNLLTRALRGAIALLPKEAQTKAKRILEKRILAGGELVSDEHYNARVNFCKTRLAGNPCEFFGPVFPGGIGFEEGCRACNCPMVTKARMKAITDPVMAEIFQGGETEITCKHPFGNLWAEIDKTF